MNVRPQIAESGRSKALSVSLNQDNSCFAVGVDSGFYIYHSDPCTKQEAKNLEAGIGIVEMLGRSNFLALVGGGRAPKFPQNKVVIWNDVKAITAFSLEFRSEIKAVRISRSRIIAVLLNSVHIYAFSQPPEKLHVFETYDNPLGLCALSAKTLAFPGRKAGYLQLFDLSTGNVTIIPAHTTPLAAISISPNGDLIATASERGTLIRVYSVATSSMIAELRRGLDHATIFSIAISPSSRKLAVTSDKSTIHVFDLPALSQSSIHASGTGVENGTKTHNSAYGDNKKWGFLSKIPLLPKYFSSEWSFAHATFEGGGRGCLGWTDEDTVILISSGEDQQAKWEKFVLVDGEVPGTLELQREGWRRYLDAE
ncbi:WD40-repeat-containing domain protein [Kalaharituber pfeilii]|nr:WD40-repeat-containing domain protein [Kalaharituber pfeilii]